MYNIEYFHKEMEIILKLVKKAEIKCIGDINGKIKNAPEQIIWILWFRGKNRSD